MSDSPVTHVFGIPDGFRIGALVSAVSREFRAVFPKTRRLRLQYHDTFDWRLYAKGLVLIRMGEEYRLRNLDDDATVATCRAKRTPSFWWDFPGGPLRDRLADILEERALIKVGEVGLRVRDIRLLNADDKTVVRARIEEGEAFRENGAPARRAGDAASGSVRLVYVLPLRGYRKAARRFVRYLAGAGLEETTRGTFDTAVEVRGRKPGDYSSKLLLPLDPSSTAQEAAGIVFNRLLDTVERNVPGIVDDIDTEFLHDFRVAIRRTRSGLSQIKGIFPDGIAKNYGSRFKSLGKSTNRLRDLDVYLLDRESYRGMLAADLRPALEPLFETLAAERREEHAAVVRVVGGGEYRSLVRDWREVLDAVGSPGLAAGNSGVPATDLSRRFISKWYARVTAAGGRIDDSSPDAQLHALRIDCKKLRYLLEFFATLYPADDIAQFIKQLKRLQDNLGVFNDLSVQLDELKHYLDRSGGRLPVDTAVAVGALIARLEDRQRDVRGTFTESFAAFAGRDNAKRFDTLFGGSRGRSV